MARDIEEFLRKAAERRQQQKGGGAPQQPKQAPPQQPRRQPPRAQEPLIIDAVEPDVVQARPVNRPPVSQPRKRSSIRNQSVADHVESHIDTSGIAEHASSLGERISSVHDQVDARISQRLDRDLTAIDDKPTVTDDPSPVIFGKRTAIAAAELHKMLQDPKSVGQAILVAEILKRPKF